MKYKVTVHEILIYLALILINFYYGLNNIQVEFDKNGILLLTAMAIIILQLILFGKFCIRDMMIISGILIVLIFNYIYMKDSRLLVIFFLTLGLKNINLNSAFKIVFYQRTIILCFIVFSSLLGFLSLGREEEVGGIRYALGYGHPNQLMVSVVICITLYLCTFWQKIRGLNYIILFLILYIGYYFSVSRTGFIVGLSILVLAVLQQYVGIEKMLNVLGKYTFLVMFFLSLYLPAIYYSGYVPLLSKIEGFTQKNRQALTLLDNALNHRLILCRVHLINTDLHLLYSQSHVSQLSNNSYTVLDSGYLNLLFVFGLAGTFIFTLINYTMAKHLIRKKQYIYLIAFIGMALYGFTENTICSLQYNFTLMFIVEIFYKNKYEEGKLDG